MLWKLYFGVMTLVIVLSFIGTLFGKPHEVYPMAGNIVLSVWMVQLVGLFGYVFRKPLLTVSMWRWLFPLAVQRIRRWGPKSRPVLHADPHGRP
jgi:hypothetical protein